ncbi:hypothetical protein AB3S75_022090 [Citrus x aurantiifolia]
MAAMVDAKPAASVQGTPLLATATLPVFTRGIYSTKRITLETSSPSSPPPPKPLIIVTPAEKGTFNVILFLHGTSLSNKSYSKIFDHIASHGFIVVAPQLYTSIPPPSATNELNSAAEVAEWLPQGLQQNLPENTEANVSLVAVMGHSRGGQTAFALSLRYGFGAVIGLDPVAGTNKTTGLDPSILSFDSFDFSIPVTVIGTGLGGVARCITACAPEGANHEEFFNRCKNSSRAHFVATDYGHMDILDDNPSDVKSWALSKYFCKNGNESRDPMRRCVSGIVVAFLKDFFDGDAEDFRQILKDPSFAPIKLDSVEYIDASSMLTTTHVKV